MLLACLLTLILALLLRLCLAPRNLPPGPWNLPVVGYLPWLDARYPYRTLTRLARKYGPVYGLHLGSVYTVVVSDAKIIRKIFNKDVASGRAPLYLTHGIMKGYGLICAEGDRWKDQRKFVHNTLRLLGAGKLDHNKARLEKLIMQNASEFVEYVRNQGEEVALDPLEPLRHSLGSAINRMVFGKSWSRSDKTWKWLQSLQEEGTKHIGVAGALNFLPFLRFLPRFKETVGFLLDGKEKTHQIYEKLVEEQSGNEDETSNFIQAFISERNKRDDEGFYTDEQFYHLLADIFGASLDTTLTTLRWYLLYLSIYPDVQKKLRLSLDGVLGTNPPTLDDLRSLPYLEASIAEVQRIRSVVPVGIPHGALDTFQMEGFTIPKGTMIVPLQWALHMNPQTWTEPEQFIPERFIDEEGKFFKPDEFMPFQAGKRMCVGDELAKMLLFFYGATILQNFRISCPSPVELEGECGITLTPVRHELVFSVFHNQAKRES